MPDWHRLVVLGCVLLVTAVVARLVDRRIARRMLPPEAQTRYRVLRRSITASSIVIGLVSALLVIPQVRAVAGGLLASSAVLGLVIGFAARSTLANCVAGLLIALAQPIRLGDRVCIDGEYGTVEEIGLTYTFIRDRRLDRLVIPNEKLASDTIRNSTIAGRDTLAEITVQVPLDDRARPAARGRARLGRGRAQDRGTRHRSRRQGNGDRARLGRRRGEGRRVRVRPPSARARAAACAGGVRLMAAEAAAPDRSPERRPPPPAARQRVRRRRRRAAAGLVLGVAALAAGGLIAAGFGGAVAFRSSCSLSALRPVSIGQNSFVYAADGSLLGSIPAERNRQPVPLCSDQPVGARRRRSRSRTGASTSTAASTTRASRAALVRDIRAGKVVEGGSTITQQLVRNLYIGRERTLKRKVKEACLAIKLSRAWSKDRILADLPEPGLLRQPRLRDRGRVADVLLEAGEEADARAGGAARGAAAGAVGLRPASPTRARRWSGATRCCTRCS